MKYDREHWEKMLPFVQAFVEGKRVTYREGDTGGGFSFEADADDYAILPDKKIIDMSIFVGSDVLMRFLDDAGEWRFGFLAEVDVAVGTTLLNLQEKVRPVMNYWNAWDGQDDWPVPEGFKFDVMLGEGTIVTDLLFMGTENARATSGPERTTAFRITGTLDGWEYE